MDNFVIEDNTISGAWYKTIELIHSRAGTQLSPLLITLSNFDAEKCELRDPVRTAIDEIFSKRKLNSVNTVANTIFPQSIYRLAKFDRHKLYKLYLDQLERMKAIDNRNKDGLYFERLIKFDETKQCNQLEFIISEFTGRRGVRKSMLQAAIFDPNRDHKRVAQLAFPCLQHVSFTYKANMLSLNAFYATQQLFDKAYGNLLGLVRLGNFMAREMHLSLEQVNCYVGVEKLERIPKFDPDITSITAIAKQYFKHE